MVQLMPLPPHYGFIKIQIGLTFLVLAYQRCPGKETTKQWLSDYLFLLPVPQIGDGSIFNTSLQAESFLKKTYGRIFTKIGD